MGPELMPDADPQGRASNPRPLIPHSGELPAHVERGRAGPAGVVRLFERGPENGHELVAHVLLQRALVQKIFFGHSFEVLAQETDHLLRGHNVRVAGEPPQVAEEHGQVLFFAAQLQSSGVLEHPSR